MQAAFFEENRRIHVGPCAPVNPALRLLPGKLITAVVPLEGLESGLQQMERGLEVRKVLIDCAG